MGLAEIVAGQATVPLPPSLGRTSAARRSTPSPPSADSVAASLELVVASHCESIDWFINYPGPVTVYSKDPTCTPAIKEALGGPERPASAGRAQVVDLANFGREGQSYIKHILANFLDAFKA